MKIPSCVFGVSQIHVGNDVHDPAVGLLRQALILAAVSRLHVENGNVQPLGRNGGQAGIGIPQNQHGVRLNGRHQLVGAVDDVAHGGAQIVPYCVHIHIRVGKSQIPEENSVQIVVVILPRVGENAVKIFAALVDDRRQTNDLRAGAYDDEQL